MIQGKAEDECLAMGFDRCFIYRISGVFGDQRTFGPAKYLMAPFKIFTYCSKAVGINITTIPKVMVKKTVQVLPEGSETQGILENSDMLKTVGTRV